MEIYEINYYKYKQMSMYYHFFGNSELEKHYAELSELYKKGYELIEEGYAEHDQSTD